MTGKLLLASCQPKTSRTNDWSPHLWSQTATPNPGRPDGGSDVHDRVNPRVTNITDMLFFWGYFCSVLAPC